MTALDDTNPRGCLDCGRTDGGCDRTAEVTLTPVIHGERTIRARVFRENGSSDS